MKDKKNIRILIVMLIISVFVGMISFIPTDPEADIEAETDSSVSETNSDTQKDPTNKQISKDIIENNGDEIQSTSPQKETETDKSDFVSEEATTQNDTKGDAKNNFTKNEIKKIIQYSELKDYNISEFYGVYEGKILFYSKDDELYYCINLKNGKIIDKFSKEPRKGSFEKGYLCYYSDNDEYIIKSLNGEKIIVPKNCSILCELLDEKVFVANRERNDYDYSGLEYAAFSFDGKQLVDWFTLPELDDLSYILCLDMGEGIVYLGDAVYQASYDDMETESYFLNVKTGKVFTWPEELPDFRTIILDYENGQSGFCTIFKDGYLNGYYSVDKYLSGMKYTTFFTYDLEGNCKKYATIKSTANPTFIKQDRTFYQYGNLCNANQEVLSDNLLLYDMYGNEVSVGFDYSDTNIKRIAINKDCFGLTIGNEEGSKENSFFTIVNYSGEKLFAPIYCTDMDISMDNEKKIFSISGNGKCTLYDYSGNVISELLPIKEKEKQLIFSKEKEYEISGATIFDNYIINIGVTDGNTIRYFIGKVQYQ